MTNLIRFLNIIILLIALICTKTISAQNYEAIKSDAEYFFKHSINQDILAIRIDTVIHNGDDIIFGNFKQIRPTDYGCFNIKGSSWLGDPVKEMPDGTFVFGVYEEGTLDSSDTYRILTLSKINVPWIFYSFHYSSEYIVAQVTEIKQMTFIGITDSVKVISLTRKNALGEIVPNPLNAQKILLSKNYGLIRLPKFDDFRSREPNSPFYEIAGKTKPETGITNLKTMQIYDFQPGDEFHIVHTEKYFYSSPYPDEIISTISKILEKINYPTNDSVSYKIERCELRSYRMSDKVNTFSYSTKTDIQTFSSAANPELETEPLEPVQSPRYGNSVTSSGMGVFNDSKLAFNKIPYKVITPYNMFQELSYNCFQQLLIDDFFFRVNYYFKGLGGPYTYFNGSGWDENSDILKYYKKGSTTWGTPLSCDSMMQVGLPEHTIYEQLKLYPIPTEGVVNVSVPNIILFPCRLELFDISGRISGSFTLNHAIQSFDLANLPAGIYLYKLTSAKRDIFRGKIIRQ